MKQPDYILPTGFKVITHATLGDTKGMMIGHENLRQRRPSAAGEIRGVVGGHGGDVYWVQHGTETMLAPYCFDEFEEST